MCVFFFSCFASTFEVKRDWNSRRKWKSKLSRGFFLFLRHIKFPNDPLSITGNSWRWKLFSTFGDLVTSVFGISHGLFVFARVIGEWNNLSARNSWKTIPLLALYSCWVFHGIWSLNRSHFLHEPGIALHVRIFIDSGQLFGATLIVHD